MSERGPYVTPRRLDEVHARLDELERRIDEDLLAAIDRLFEFQVELAKRTVGVQLDAIRTFTASPRREERR